jgi:two-component system catabolic regulation response regulator CreB
MIAGGEEQRNQGVDSAFGAATTTIAGGDALSPPRAGVLSATIFVQSTRSHVVVSTVFVVEDEPSIAEAVCFALQGEGYRSRHFVTGQTCLTALAEETPALIVLDIGLPDGSGFDLFRRIRAVCNVPVVFLTARGAEIDRVAGLEMGADDYIVKPFSVRELVARARMVLRRHAALAEPRPPPARSADDSPFEHDELRREVRFRGRLLPLTLHEYRLLDTLLRHPGRVFSRGQLLEQAWEAPDHRLERTIDSHVKSLRAKLREVDDSSDPIKTHRGMGYSLEPPA